MNNYSNEPIWTVEQVAKRWQCSERTVRDMLLQKEINGFKIRNAWRIPSSEVIAYEERPQLARGMDAQLQSYARNAVVTKIAGVKL